MPVYRSVAKTVKLSLIFLSVVHAFSVAIHSYAVNRRDERLGDNRLMYSLHYSKS